MFRVLNAKGAGRVIRGRGGGGGGGWEWVCVLFVVLGCGRMAIDPRMHSRNAGTEHVVFLTGQARIHLCTKSEAP